MRLEMVYVICSLLERKEHLLFVPTITQMSKAHYEFVHALLACYCNEKISNTKQNL